MPAGRAKMNPRDATLRWEGNRLRPDAARLAVRLRALEAEVKTLEQARRALEQEVVQHRRAEELARDQSKMLIESLGILAAEIDLDRFLGHVLRVTVQQLEGVGGTLWFPDPLNGGSRLHLEYLDSNVISASNSQHSAVLKTLP